jgi:hypothetical protein
MRIIPQKLHKTPVTATRSKYYYESSEIQIGFCDAGYNRVVDIPGTENKARGNQDDAKRDYNKICSTYVYNNLDVIYDSFKRKLHEKPLPK